MASALAREAADKKSTRILRRDERRQVEDAYKVRGAGINKVVTKEVTKNPTRVIPELPGFHGLTKLEFKRDTRDIDKRSILMNMNETDSEDELETSVPVTTRPPCNADSTLYKKKERFQSWMQSPGLINKDLHQTALAYAELQRELARVHAEDAHWLNSLEIGRGQVSAGLAKNKECIARLCREMQHLYSLSLAECGPAVRKRRSLSMRDCLEELAERKQALAVCIQDYDRLSNDALVAAGKETGKAADMHLSLAKGIPMTRVTISESDILAYQCDTEVYAAVSSGSAAGKCAPRPDRADQAADAETAFRASLDASRAAFALAEKDRRAKAAEEESAAAMERLLQRNTEQRDLAAAFDIPRGSCLSAVEGAAGAANAESSRAAGATLEEKQHNGRVSRSKDIQLQQQLLQQQQQKEKDTAATASASSAAASEIADGTAIGSSAMSDPARELIQLFASVEEAIVMSRNCLGDLDVFFSEDTSAVADDKIRAAVQRSSSFSGASGVASPRSPRSGSIVDEAIRDLGPGDSSLRGLQAVVDFTSALVPKSEESGRSGVSGLSGLRTEKDWIQYLKTFVKDKERSEGQRANKRGGGSSRAAGVVPLQTFVYGRTPRGVPLLLSPLSQFEDRFMGAIFGGPPASSLYNGNIDPLKNKTLPNACSAMPQDLVREENRVMEHCSMQSAAASAESRDKRLRSTLQDLRRQRETSEISQATAEQVYIHTLLEDTIESKRIRRELHAFGIASEPLPDRKEPMSPLAETSGWNSSSTSHGADGPGMRGGGGRGAALGAHYSRGPSWGRGKGKKGPPSGKPQDDGVGVGVGGNGGVGAGAIYNEQAVRDAALYSKPGRGGLAAAATTAAANFPAEQDGAGGYAAHSHNHNALSSDNEEGGEGSGNYGITTEEKRGYADHGNGNGNGNGLSQASQETVADSDAGAGAEAPPKKKARGQAAAAAAGGGGGTGAGKRSTKA